MTVGLGAIHAVQFMTAWGAQDGNEVVHGSAGFHGYAADDAVAAAPWLIKTGTATLPSGQGTDGVLDLDTATTVASSYIEGATTGISPGVSVYPLANPTEDGSNPGLASHIFGCDSGGLAGVNVGWTKDDGAGGGLNLVLCSQSAVTIYATSSLRWGIAGSSGTFSTKWLWLSLTHDATANTWTLYIHDYTAGVINPIPIEVVQAVAPTVGTSGLSLRLGQTAGASGLRVEVAAIYSGKGGGSHGPLSPKFVSDTVTDYGEHDSPANNANIVDYNGTDTSDDWTMIDEAPGAAPTDTNDYIKFASSFVGQVQLYDFPDAMVGGTDNILAAGVISRAYSTTTNALHVNGFEESGGANDVGISEDVGNFNVWGYPASYFGHEINGANWTIAKLNAVEVYIQLRPIFSECRRSTVVVTVAHGENSHWARIRSESGYKITPPPVTHQRAGFALGSASPGIY